MIAATNTVAALAERRAAQTPDAAAFLEADGTTVTFAAILSEAQALARGLAALGLAKGETISMQLPNWREAAAINLAAAMLGLRLNPITPIYRSAELRMILEDAGTRLLFIPHSFRSQPFAQMIAELRPDLPTLEHVLTLRHRGGEGATYEGLLAQHGDGTPIPSVAVEAQDAKLLLYTSGTTGRAKGAIDGLGLLITEAAAFAAESSCA